MRRWASWQKARSRRLLIALRHLQRHAPDRPMDTFLRTSCHIMSAGHVFGPDLRRARVKRGIALEEISRRTNVSIDLWAAMERNDFSRWPTGIYARAYVREYARAIGVDPDATVDEFCRSFPQGDRRTERILREQAA